MMNILISVNRDYLDKAETMLHSLRRNDSEDVTVYLINHSLDSVDLNKFEKYLLQAVKKKSYIAILLLLNGRRTIRTLYRRIKNG